MTSKEVIDSILDKIREKGFHPIDISYGDGYFIFEFGEDTVCHFRIRENRGFQFGIWTVKGDKDDPNIVAKVFAQYGRNINKFKPSRSFYCENVCKWINDPEFTADDLSFWDVQDMVNEIAKHRFVAFYKDATDSKWQVSGPKALWAFCHFNVTHFFRFIFKWMMNYCQICDTWVKLFFMQAKDKRILQFKIIDEDKHMPGWHSSPQFQPWLLMSEELSEEERDAYEHDFCVWRNKTGKDEISFPRFFVGEFPPEVVDLDEEDPDQTDENTEEDIPPTEEAVGEQA